jgi:hypothetical protein
MYLTCFAAIPLPCLLLGVAYESLRTLVQTIRLALYLKGQVSFVYSGGLPSEAN